MSEIVLVEKEGPLALITLNRPEKLNALDYALIDRLMEVLDAIEDDDGTRVLVLTGAGTRAFSSGADIACFAASVRRGQAVALREFVRRGQRLTGRIETFPKPIIAAVNGLAHGGGCEITEAAPLAIASDHAEFCKAEINLGFAPPFGGTQRLPAADRSKARATDDPQRSGQKALFVSSTIFVCCMPSNRPRR
jgi:enoyl-CoA hydratase